MNEKKKKKIIKEKNPMKISKKSKEKFLKFLNSRFLKLCNIETQSIDNKRKTKIWSERKWKEKKKISKRKVRFSFPSFPASAKNQLQVLRLIIKMQIFIFQRFGLKVQKSQDGGLYLAQK